jgi:hypothetical protein
MSEASIASRCADLQVPLGRILTLASLAQDILDGQGGIEDEGQRREAGQLTDLVGLLSDVAQKAIDDAEAIEIYAGRLEKRS